MRLIDADNVHIPIQTAVESKVSHLGIDTVICAVVNGNDQQFVVLQLLADVHTPGGVAAVMMGQQVTICVDISGGIGATDLKVIQVCSGESFLVQLLGVIGGSTVVVVAAVLAVDGVIAMGQVDLFPVNGKFCGQGSGFFGKSPVCVEIVNSSHE